MVNREYIGRISGWGGRVTQERQIAWWVADIANLISITFAVIARFCVGFAAIHHADLERVDYRFLVQLSECLGYVAIGWIIIGGGLATTCWVRSGKAEESALYFATALFAVIGVVLVFTSVLPA